VRLVPRLQSAAAWSALLVQALLVQALLVQALLVQALLVQALLVQALLVQALLAQAPQPCSNPSATLRTITRRSTCSFPVTSRPRSTRAAIVMRIHL
jgi:hypothetical protein